MKNLFVILTFTAKNTVISPDFLVWKFCGKGQFWHSFGQFAQNYAETVPFRKISTPGNPVKLRFFQSASTKLLVRPMNDRQKILPSIETLNPASTDLSKDNNENTRTMRKISSKSIIKTPERRH